MRPVAPRMSIAEALEVHRVCRGLNKTEFAAMLDLNLSNYSDMLHGRRGLSYNAAKRAYEIGVPADVLFQTPIHTRKPAGRTL